MKREAEFFIPKPAPTGQRGTGVHAAHFVYLNERGQRLYWSAPFPLPGIGDRIVISMNGIGPGVVRGYFSEAGYVGVMTCATKPPRWLQEQRQRDARSDDPEWVKQGIGCEFGAEIKLPAPPAGKTSRSGSV